MTERERLIELLLDGAIASVEKENHLEAFADYLLEHGVIVPSCNVGDTIYDVTWGKMYKYKVHALTYSTNGQNGEWVLCVYDFDDDNARLSANKIGKTVFLTKEEAEKALKEMENK